MIRRVNPFQLQFQRYAMFYAVINRETKNYYIQMEDFYTEITSNINQYILYWKISPQMMYFFIFLFYSLHMIVLNEIELSKMKSFLLKGSKLFFKHNYKFFVPFGQNKSLTIFTSNIAFLLPYFISIALQLDPSTISPLSFHSLVSNKSRLDGKRS